MAKVQSLETFLALSKTKSELIATQDLVLIEVAVVPAQWKESIDQCFTELA